MANNGPTVKQEPDVESDEAWNEEQLKQAMDQLNLLHIKLRGLRAAVPHMMESLSFKQPSPQAKFNSFIEAVGAANKDLQDFQDLRKSADMTKIMNHATERRKQEPNGIKPWRVTDHPDWMTVDPKQD
ncbi:hypothetical protein CPLU01_06459 [Colletotrichum plurivorum]|uniref:Uncharacterized protein n=1 Tax=Colletotrichum plurivorum TaxID=2175906 RepID=A0A8H6KHY7_9PEZI|nr:hypothetical protein CPLU01_06459 [Colletotrichum plurivorum]